MGNQVTLKAIIDIAGKPESALSKALDKVEERIDETESFEILEIAKAEPELQDSGMYTAFLDLELKCSNPRSAMNFIVEFLPSSVEIIDPKNLKVSCEEFSDVLNDMVHFQIKNVNENHKLQMHNHMLQRRIQEFEKNNS